ncbi:unnamed protein product [Fusarium equiseti]|uniref:Uncharacterized protein n=1 Tax=Fusarium equiseti TaxID=61235 RepID=A0A8J2IYP5_FUSEQ|nr:unnamed protein product [Fusarium equiseti]
MTSSTSAPVDDSSVIISASDTPSPIMMPSAIMDSSPSTSDGTATDKKVEEFRRFPDLPKELRLGIWEAMAPTQHDALMGCRVTSDDDDNGTTNYWKILSPLMHPDTLTGRGSCKEALKTWRKAKILTLFMPLRSLALTSLDHLSLNVEAIATLWPDPRMLNGLFLSLQRRETYLQLKPVKTFYVGLTAIVCDQTVSPDAYSELGEMKFRTYTLDDPALVDLLSKCNAPRKRHASDECFLATIQDYWGNDERNEELRETWRHLRNLPRGELLPELKPVIIAVNTMQHIELRSALDFRTHLIQSKVSYSCETSCMMEADFMAVPPHLRPRLIRQHRCERCWPAQL